MICDSLLILITTIVAFVIACVAGVCGAARDDSSFVGAYTELQNDTFSNNKDLQIGRSRQKMTRREIFEKFCYPSGFKLQAPQEFIGRFIGPKSPHMNLLGFHRIGAGKTCAAITAAEMHLQNDASLRVIVVMPASLTPGFRNELRGQCSKFSYITQSEREELKILQSGSARYREIVDKSNELIDTRYLICSYNKFITEGHKFNTNLLIIDEVQNVAKPGGVCNASLRKYIAEHPNMKLLVFSATPIFDSAREFVNLLQLMRQNVDYTLVDTISTMAEATINQDLRNTLGLTMPHIKNELSKHRAALADAVNGLVSYYRGAPPATFPKVTINISICKMSAFQSKWYIAEIEAEMARNGVRHVEINDNFYIKSRARSNIVYPKGLNGTDGLPLLDKSAMGDIGTYSCKFAKLMRRLNKGQLSFVYSNFVSFGGIKPLTKLLKHAGWLNFAKHGPGKYRFAIWTGKQTAAERDAIRNTFNGSANDNAGQLQIIIGSPSMREGVSLFRVRQVHCIEPYWNHSRLEQIYGRANRFCSHKSLPAAERTLDIYLYIAVTNQSNISTKDLDIDNDKLIDPKQSVDAYILSLANHKKLVNDMILETVISNAVDAKLGFGR